MPTPKKSRGQEEKPPLSMQKKKKKLTDRQRRRIKELSDDQGIPQSTRKFFPHLQTSLQVFNLENRFHRIDEFLRPADRCLVEGEQTPRRPSSLRPFNRKGMLGNTAHSLSRTKMDSRSIIVLQHEFHPWTGGRTLLISTDPSASRDPLLVSEERKTDKR